MFEIKADILFDGFRRDNFMVLFDWGWGIWKSYLIFLGVFLSAAVPFVCDILRQIILYFGGCSGRSEDLIPVPAMPILTRVGSFLPIFTLVQYWF